MSKSPPSLLAWLQVEQKKRAHIYYGEVWAEAWRRAIAVVRDSGKNVDEVVVRMEKERDT